MAEPKAAELKAVQVRLPPQILERLDFLMEYYGMNQTEVIRYLITKRADDIRQEMREDAKRAAK